VDNQKLALRHSITERDRERLVSLTRDTGFFYDHETKIAQELMETAISKGDASGYYFLIAELDNTPVGYCCFGDVPLTVGSFDIYWLVTDKHHQRKGIGGLLLKEAERSIRQRNGVRVYIETSGRPLYEPTSRFYVRHGYREEARLRDFYNVGDDKIIFSKSLA
jgi:GNAT superfamily N-acetyltransferase